MKLSTLIYFTIGIAGLNFALAFSIMFCICELSVRLLFLAVFVSSLYLVLSLAFPSKKSLQNSKEDSKN